MLISSVLQTQLFKILHDSMKEGYKATFLHGSGKEGETMAEKFATTIATKASGQLANAITSYIKMATITGGMVTTAGSPAAQSGPITTPPIIS